ncbi:caspase Dronc-like isoform X2 [Leguminivora glycinivorella]|uniref:caspase Dronc-like isoform X2 n=1 Tax=Leguminivora glycinivorella TaxID=1035111 RepID=UPI00200DA7E0|nr:caspase Dronc-like isoform X2 [Leguminivora glycinivorella]
MQDEHRAAIQKCFTSLVEQTDLETMVSALYEKGVFSEAMIEPYKDTSKESRLRKRQLYMDVMRRGPHAFRHLVDALMETGAWILARELDPESLPMRRPERLAPNPQPIQPPPIQPLPTLPTTPFETPDIPKINVVKSTKFMDDNGKDIKLYPTRGRRRGVLVVFSYIEFREHTMETYRRGVDVDCQMLKNLFSEIGFEVISYQNLTRDETLAQMKNLPLKGAECVFIVISSHGYGRDGSWDTDIRCSDGGLISAHAVVDHFNNQNCPVLIGIPKVFIFQMCRGENRYLELQAEQEAATDGAPYGSEAPRSSPAPRRRDRVYSDILIAHSTLPGFVSHRDMDKGSWFIQALCEVFAANAHECHVVTLFTLVDKALQERFHVQTSVVENWGFNCKLYLHPGLFED